MKKTIQLLAFCCVTLILLSCNNKKSLQTYLVESQDKVGFIAVDLPTSFLELKNEDASEDVKATLESIRKVSVVALPYKGNETSYEEEKNNIKAIFKGNDEYASLMKMKIKGMNMNVFYTGEANAIDEIIVFGYGKDAGVGIARLLGDDMNPSKIMNVLNELKVNPDNLNLKQFSAIFAGK
jgi:hypothetical protein